MQLPNFITRMVGFADKAEAHFLAEAKLVEAQMRISSLETEISALQAAAADHAGQVTDLNARLTTAQAAEATQAAEITKLQADLEAERRRTVETLAAQGLSPDALPATAPNGSPTGAALDPITKLREELQATTDPQRKFTLSQEIRKLLDANRRK